ncbi:DNA glycosylase AlkZ-like family protein [Brachybacterium sp. DNPG3]
MSMRHLAGARILAQGLVGPGPAAPVAPDPVEVARSFGAHQGQDLPGVLSSLALRAGGDAAALDAVLAAFDRGEIVRGYPMRGTAFALAADTVAWLTALCADGPARAADARRPRLGIEDEHVHRAREVLERILPEVSQRCIGRGLLRAEVLAAWEEAGVPLGPGAGYHLLVRFLHEGILVYGPWRPEAKETAVVHAPSWLPPGTDLAGAFDGDRTAATAELALRYATSHGPVTVRDLAWWSKLPLGAIRAAWPLIEDRLEHGLADATGRIRPVGDPAGTGETLWFRPGLVEEYAEREKETMRELLLPGFDELVLGYADRLYLMDAARHAALVPGNNGVFKRSAIRRGELVGLWSRTGTGAKRRLDLADAAPSAPISPAQRRRFETLFAAFPAVDR